MKTTRIGAAVMGLIGAMMGAKAQKDEQSLKLSQELINSQKYQREGHSKLQTSTKRHRTASMPEYYGYRKRPCVAIDKKGNRVDSSVKNAIKQRFQIVSISNYEA